ncbi:MAG: glycoside hydrolase family 3 C-terminal domain-containing protein [Lentimicrobiaceae bacterium]|nr:glycoside hydrolase family 3 C-terminal domain-containing protein [Lentimicrobiaceae bacterium]
MYKQVVFLFFVFIGLSSLNAQPLYLNPEADTDARVKDLIGQLTLEEKASQMLMSTPAIPRLNIPPYDYWNEALHGVGRSGTATVFPQAIGLAATFDNGLIYQVSSAISDEARAKYNAAIAAGNYNRYTGLTFWTPNINIFRDPRWGRGQETYGEDPYLTSLLGVSFVKGLQGNHPDYLKTSACAKHFAVHSGPEKSKHSFNAKVSPKDLYETYLPAFKALVDAGVESVMCAYNRTNDEPCCANNYLLSEVLFGKWGFKGHVVSDCWALVDFYAENGHGTVDNKTEAAALALKSGVNLNCGDTYTALVDAVRSGLVEESLLDEKLFPLLKTRFKLGMFDPMESNPYNAIAYEVVDSKENRALAYEAAKRSIVLLKNNGVLPLKNNLNRYYVVGPNAASIDALLGNYFGVNPNIVTFLEGITAGVAKNSQVQYSPGTTLDRKNVNPIDWSSGEAAEADVTIVAMGLTRHIEGEEGESVSSPYFGDRLDYNIPENQIDYLKKIKGTHGKPVIAVITGGSPMNLSEVHEIADAVLLTWYPGEEGGHALADILFGNAVPSGRLPVTFPKSLEQLPPYEDYAMKGRTYRYMTEEPMYPFGFGLSYTSFSYSDVRLLSSTIKKGESTEISCTVTNTGQYASVEVAQLYITDNQASVETPLFSLKGIQCINLKPGESKKVVFAITPQMLELINEQGEAITEAGDFTLAISGSLPTQRALTLGASAPVRVKLTLE